MKYELIKGGSHSDNRGDIIYNNNFDASSIKRMYIIKNKSTSFVRAWQGHAIERRWFSVVKGSFKIKIIKINNWESPDKDSKVYSVVLNDQNLDTLCVPKGYVNSIQALEKDSKLMVMSDYLLGEIQDEYRFEPNYFTKL